MMRRVLLLLTALIAAAMMSVGPVFAHSGNHHHCDWDGHGNDHWDECHDNGDDGDDDDGDGVLGFLPGYIQNMVD